MKRIFLLAVAVSGLTLLGAAPAGAQGTAAADRAWTDKGAFLRDTAVNDIQVVAESVLVATPAEVYLSPKKASRWVSAFSLPRGSNEICCVAALEDGMLFAGTQRGLYASVDGGANWRNVFRTVIPEKNHILSIAVSRLHPQRVLLGTMQGVFVSDDGGARWQDISGTLRGRAVQAVAINHTGFYAGGGFGLCFMDTSRRHWERLIVGGGEETEAAVTDEAPEELLSEGAERAVTSIAMNDTDIYAAVGRVVYSSALGEREWSAVPANGLEGHVASLLVSSKKGTIFAATDKGVFEYLPKDERWEGLSAGMPHARGRRIVFESEEEEALWAATDKGVFRMETVLHVSAGPPDVEGRMKETLVVIDNEPSFNELQEAAIQYAEVSPEKIRRWRNEARCRALVPKLSFGANNRLATNSEIYTSATKDYVVVGPDDVSKTWDVSISWELGDFIWSDDQTNIDVRSKLMVQLRNDILDDLRRAYYERKRLRFEMMYDPPKTAKARFEKELRIQELGSTLDSLTGGYFSRSRDGAEEAATEEGPVARP